MEKVVGRDTNGAAIRKGMRVENISECGTIGRQAIVLEGALYNEVRVQWEKLTVSDAFIGSWPASALRIVSDKGEGK